MKQKRKSATLLHRIVIRFRSGFARAICRLFGHRVQHEVWECHHPDYWTPEIDERFWCSRCDQDL